MENVNNQTIKKEFYHPIMDIYPSLKNQRECKSFSDLEYLKMGIGRTIMAVSSGRDWVQQYQMNENSKVSVGDFFDALKSPRRMAMIEEAAQKICLKVNESTKSNHDPFYCFPEMKKFAVYATDGHSNKASAHDPLIKDKKRACAHIYSLNLRTHSMTHLTHCQPNEGKKKKHEIMALKELDSSILRMNERTGIKVIHAYDPAIVDYAAWRKWKNTKGIYIITIEKANSALEAMSVDLADREDPVNIGVISDQLVGSPSSGEALRRIEYEDPATGNVYKFITNEMTLRAGIIAYCYKMRWDIEKTFDETETKLLEDKEWGKSAVAKRQHGCFVSMGHNLMLLLERTIEETDGIIDQKSLDKQIKRKIDDIQKALQNNREPNYLIRTFHRVTQRSLQFIRWLRVVLINQEPRTVSIGKLKPYMEAFIE